MERFILVYNNYIKLAPKSQISIIKRLVFGSFYFVRREEVR
nr:MAG TPA: hypothetical protein [Bacteriophage sp.]